MWQREIFAAERMPSHKVGKCVLFWARGKTSVYWIINATSYSRFFFQLLPRSTLACGIWHKVECILIKMLVLAGQLISCKDLGLFAIDKLQRTLLKQSMNTWQLLFMKDLGKTILTFQSALKYLSETDRQHIAKILIECCF